jgi:hypothetical protein
MALRYLSNHLYLVEKGAASIRDTGKISQITGFATTLPKYIVLKLIWLQVSFFYAPSFLISSAGTLFNQFFIKL